MGGSEGPCAAAAAGDRGGRSGLLQVPTGENPLPRGRVSVALSLGFAQLGSSSVQWLRAQVPGLAGEEALLVALGCVSPLSPPPLFFPTPFSDDTSCSCFKV